MPVCDRDCENESKGRNGDNNLETKYAIKIPRCVAPLYSYVQYQNLLEFCDKYFSFSNIVNIRMQTF